MKPKFGDIEESDNSNLMISCMKSSSYCFNITDYLNKLLHFSQIDFHSSYLQVLDCFNPKELNEMAKIRKNLKNQWARDDPGFVLIVISKILISTFCLCLAFGRVEIQKYFQLILFNSIFMFIIMGILIAMLFKSLAEKYLKIEQLGLSNNQSIEFLYAFDVHCNSFVPFYTFTTIVYFLILPLVISDSFLSVALSNLLLLIGILYYFYVTLTGYYTLPFIRKVNSLMYVMWPIIITIIIHTFLRINIIRTIWMRLLI